MLAIGSRAPEFTLPDQDDRNVSLTTLLNRGPLGLGVRRGTYLIDQARQIKSAVLADFRISQHEDLPQSHRAQRKHTDFGLTGFQRFIG